MNEGLTDRTPAGKSRNFAVDDKGFQEPSRSLFGCDMVRSRPTDQRASTESKRDQTEEQSEGWPPNHQDLSNSRRSRQGPRSGKLGFERCEVVRGRQGHCFRGGFHQSFFGQSGRALEQKEEQAQTQGDPSAVKPVSKPISASDQASFDRSDRAADSIRRFFVGQAVQVAKRERLPISIGELAEFLMDHAAKFNLDRFLGVGSGFPVSFRPELFAFGPVDFLFPRSGGDLAGNPGQPAVNLFGVLDRRGSLHQDQKGRLHCVFGGMGIVDEPAANAQDGGTVAGDEVAKSLRVPATDEAFDQLTVDRPSRFQSSCVVKLHLLNLAKPMTCPLYH